MKLLLDENLSRRLVHLAMGNASNDAVLAALLAAADRLQLAFDEPATGVVVIT